MSTWQGVLGLVVFWEWEFHSLLLPRSLAYNAGFRWPKRDCFGLVAHLHLTLKKKINEYTYMCLLGGRVDSLTFWSKHYIFSIMDIETDQYGFKAKSIPNSPLHLVMVSILLSLSIKQASWYAPHILFLVGDHMYHYSDFCMRF